MSHLRTVLFPAHPSARAQAAAPRSTRTRRGAAGAAGVLALALAVSGCASSAASSSSSGPASFGTASVALSWIKNYEFAGYYFAEDDGDYTDAGFDKVDLIAGGGNTNSWDLVLSGQAQVGLASDLTGITGAINDGAGLKIIGAQFVKNPVGFVSLAGNPIRTVADLKGKRIGVDAGGKLAVEAVLKANDLPADTVEFVSVPNGVDPLMNGEVDALIGFLTNYPIAVKNAGGDVVTMSFADANYAQFGDAVVVSDKELAENRDELKAIMKANIEGWNTALTKGTDAIADIAMKHGGADNGLDKQLQVDSASVLPSFMLTPDTVKNGIFTLTPDLVDQAVASLAAAGITADPSMFDTSLLQEVYAENPDLIPGFTVPAS
ncbi:ABC transporter substrate-binding protein [Microbacterium hydrothermale]|uniref:ABC transporter substrate-binding protein n=1 Tax=Microbacterium hydrothermale TaxID=857427 RepID=UPI0010A7748F|nr:ABC transporter substrate-binding protein [Microbacterium hydrothermale]